MIRIDVVEHTPKQVVLQVQGNLHATEMDLLEGEVRRWRAQVAHVVLDLTKSAGGELDGAGAAAAVGAAAGGAGAGDECTADAAV